MFCYQLLSGIFEIKTRFPIAHFEPTSSSNLNNFWFPKNSQQFLEEKNQTHVKKLMRKM